jgi:hypothetical protein
MGNKAQKRGTRGIWQDFTLNAYLKMQPRLQGLEHLHLCLYIALQWCYTATKKEIGNFMNPQ